MWGFGTMTDEQGNGSASQVSFGTIQGICSAAGVTFSVSLTFLVFWAIRDPTPWGPADLPVLGLVLPGLALLAWAPIIATTVGDESTRTDAVRRARRCLALGLPIVGVAFVYAIFIRVIQNWGTS